MNGVYIIVSYPEELEITKLFPFTLDLFQEQAINALNANKSVVVCAPTGSGKTLIGEYAIYRALTHKHRVFYTTPLKALSNQKLRDFRALFGADNVGLLTGDLSVNREAPILVMTTEIFRNMLYGTPIGEVGTSLVGVETVVLDECHYMNDRQRGTVWEESIIYCPKEIQLVALSATVANSEQLTDWINQVHGPTELIYSDFRPVPLQFHFANDKGLFPLLDEQQKRIHPRLVSRKKPKEQRGHIPVPSLTQILTHLKEREMLPAIYFIFSRRGCDRAVTEIGNLSLVTPDESQELRRLIREFLEKNPEAGRVGQIEPLCQGIAAHHAGILPAWKGLVEELFTKGLIKVVFATETLAAGINMPARTTVISTLSKRTDRGHRLLNPSEFLQMAGRAGRRGMDALGYVVTVQTPFEGAKEAAYLATSKADALASQFTPSYGMVLNLLQTHSIEEAKELVERSFGQYLSTLYLEPQEAFINHLRMEINQIIYELERLYHGEIEALEKLLMNYEKIREHLREEKRLLKTLQHQAEETLAKDMSLALSFATIGTIISLKGKNVPTAKRPDSRPITAILVEKIPGSGQAPHYVCLGGDNRWYVVTCNDMIALHADLPRLVMVENLIQPSEMLLKLGQCRKGDEQTQIIAQQIPERPISPYSPEVMTQQERVDAIEKQLGNHPIYQCGNPSKILKRFSRLDGLQKEVYEQEIELEKQRSRYWEEFINLIGILQTFGGLNELTPSLLGQACAAIRGDNELWLGLVFMSGLLDQMDPHHLATTCAALVTEVSRPDTWTRYTLSPEVEQVLEQLQKGIRRKLFQVQYRHHTVIPVWLERDLIAVVEQWALGVEWTELVENTSLDEGDVVRILRRTLDLLSQIPHVPHLSESLQMNAYRAMQLIDRFPVNEAVD